MARLHLFRWWGHMGDGWHREPSFVVFYFAILFPNTRIAEYSLRITFSQSNVCNVHTIFMRSNDKFRAGKIQTKRHSSLWCSRVEEKVRNSMIIPSLELNGNLESRNNKNNSHTNLFFCRPKKKIGFSSPSAVLGCLPLKNDLHSRLTCLL